MNMYQCPSCGAAAYSSANSLRVGVCPRCAAPLSTVPGTPATGPPAAAPAAARSQ